MNKICPADPTPKGGWWSYLRRVLDQGSSICQDYMAGTSPCREAARCGSEVRL